MKNAYLIKGLQPSKYSQFNNKYIRSVLWKIKIIKKASPLHIKIVSKKIFVNNYDLIKITIYNRENKNRSL